MSSDATSAGRRGTSPAKRQQAYQQPHPASTVALRDMWALRCADSRNLLLTHCMLECQQDLLLCLNISLYFGTQWPSCFRLYHKQERGGFYNNLCRDVVEKTSQGDRCGMSFVRAQLLPRLATHDYMGKSLFSRPSLSAV